MWENDNFNPAPRDDEQCNREHIQQSEELTQLWKQAQNPWQQMNKHCDLQLLN